MSSEKYVQKIQRAHPGLIYLILDDSGSMADTLPGTTDPKFAWVARYAGIILKELLARSTEMPGDQPVVKARYYLRVWLYGSTPRAWPKQTTDPIDIGEIVKAYAGASGGGSQNSLGLKAALGGTDAASAFREAASCLATDVASPLFKDSFPPLIFHLSDGHSASDASGDAQRMARLSTTDGETLVVNALIGTSTSLKYTDPADFPGYTNEGEAGPDPDSVRMFSMSSIMPATIKENLVADGIFPAIRDQSRLYFDVRTKEMLKHVIQTVGSVGSRQGR